MPTVTPQSDRGLRSALGQAALHGTAASILTALGDYAGTGSFTGWSPMRLAAYFGIHWGLGLLLATCAVLLVAGGDAAASALSSLGRAPGASAESARPRRRELLAPLPFVVLSLYPAIAFAHSLFSGAYASQLRFRGALVASTAAILVGGVYAAALLVRSLARPPRARAFRCVVAFGLFAGGAGLMAANQLVLPNLYPAVHGVASLVTFGSFAAASVAVGSTLSVTRAPVIERTANVFLFVGSAAALVFTLVSVERSPVLRLALFDPRASVSQSLMRVIEPLASAMAASTPSRARPSSIEVEPVDALGGPVRRGAHIVLITVDALRADHLGSYGYSRETSPAIDMLAREGVVFDHAYSQAPHSSYSLCSLMTSEYLHETLDLGLSLPDATLPRVLRGHGYHTSGIYTRGIFHTDGDRLRMYDERRFDLDHRDHRALDADARTDVAVSEIDRIVAHGEPPSFLWVHYFDAHEPYHATTFGTRDIDRYDSEIKQVDGAVARLVREARARLDRDVIFVLTADHGEEFRDHGGLYHGTSVYEEQIRVPLIIIAPGVAPRRVAAPVELVDVAPTLLRLVDAEVPSTMRGDDLRGALVGQGAAPRMAVSAVLSKRTIIEWPYKLVHDTRFRLVELFDLDADPRERANLAARDPERVASLESDLAAFLDGLSQPARAAPDPTLLAMRRARLHDPRAVAPLTAIALDASAPGETRQEAVRLLGGLRDPSTRDALVRLLGARDARLAEEAAIALASLRDGHGRSRLVGVLDRGGGGDLRFRAAVALGLLGDTRAVPALIEVLEDGEDIRERRVATQVLGDLRDARAVDALIGSMTEFRLRAHASVALGKIGDRRAYDVIAASLETDRHASMRDAMASALGDLGDPRALPVLLAMASDEPEVMNATRAVIRLGGLGRGLVGGTSLWGRERPSPRNACTEAGSRRCSADLRAIDLPLRAPPPVRVGQVQAVLRARVGRGETMTLSWEIGGVPLTPVVLDGEARELRVPVPVEALRAPRVTARLMVVGRARLVVDHLLLLPARPTGGV